MESNVRRARYTPGATRRVALVLFATVLSCGCAGKGGNNSLAGASQGGGKSRGGIGIPFTPFKLPGGGGSAPASAPPMNMDEIRSQVMSLSDSYTQTVLQSLDALVASSKDPKKIAWARGQRLATITVSTTNATGPNALVGLLDMVVFATLKREAVEKHWVPTVLGEEGRGVAEAHRRGEAEAWDAAGRALSRSHCEQLRNLIDQWRAEHPEQYYVGYTRFSDFDAYRNLSPQSPEAKNPGSLFSLFYVDPLAGLDPVAKELRSYRALTERIAYIGSRFPILATYQIDLAVSSAVENPEMRSIVASTEKFADATDRFATAVTAYPKDLSTEREAAVRQVAEVTARERQAAIEQAARSVAAERETILKEIQAQDGRIQSILKDVTQLVVRAEQAGTAVNASTAQTVTTAEQATRRTLDRAFALTIALVLVLLLGVPLVLLLYRVTTRRLLDPPLVPRTR